MPEAIGAPKPSDQSQEMAAFVEALNGIDPSAPTRCQGWTAHDLLAHIVAGGEEIRRLVAATLAGEPAGRTRGFAEREAPLAAMSPAAVQERLTVIGLDLLAALDTLHATTRLPPWPSPEPTSPPPSS